MSRAEIVLGTAQFATQYGFDKPLKQNSNSDELQLCELARNKHRICTIDAATSYNKIAEKISSGSLKNFERIVTKVKIPEPFGVKSKQLSDIIVEEVLDWMKRAGRERVEALLLHGTKNLDSKTAPAVQGALDCLVDQELVGEVGVSIYTQKEFFLADSLLNFDVVQIPVNPINQEFLNFDGQLISQIKNKKVQARSVFHQGFLLSDLKNFDKKFDCFKSSKRFFDEFCGRRNLTNLEFCVLFTKNIRNIDEVVIGVNNSAELEQILAAFDLDLQLDMSEDELYELGSHDKILTDIRNWKNL